MSQIFCYCFSEELVVKYLPVYHRPDHSSKFPFYSNESELDSATPLLASPSKTISKKVYLEEREQLVTAVASKS